MSASRVGSRYLAAAILCVAVGHDTTGAAGESDAEREPSVQQPVEPRRSPPPLNRGTAEVRIRRTDRESAAFLDVEGCLAKLEHYASWNSIDYRNTCPWPLGEKVELLSELLDALFGADGIPSEIDSFYAGRIVVLSQDLAHEVALAAHRDPEWERQLARWRELGPGDHGGANVFVSRLIDAHDLYREISVAFEAHGVTLRGASVEKVLMAVPRRIPGGEKLLARGADPEVRLPFDAIVWFALEREPAAAPQGES